MTHLVYCQEWEESERGWGVRPDGISLHLEKEDIPIFVEAYWMGMPEYTPDEYSRPAGIARLIKISDKTFNDIYESDWGIRIYDKSILWTQNI